MCRFLSRCVLIDDSRARRHYFVCDAWLSDEIGDCSVDRIFKEATNDELHRTEHLFFSYTNM